MVFIIGVVTEVACDWVSISITRALLGLTTQLNHAMMLLHRESFSVDNVMRCDYANKLE